MNRIILLVLLSIAQVFNPGVDASHDLEAALKAELGDKLDVVQVEMEVPTGAFLEHNRINEVEVAFDGLYIKPMMLRRAQIKIEGVQLDDSEPAKTGIERVKSVGTISYELVVQADDLARALAEKSKTIKNPRITIDDGIATLSGSLKFGFIKTPFEVSGRPTFEKHSQIVYRVTEVKFVGIPLPGSLKQLIEDDINPIFDLDEFYEKKKEDLAQTEKMLHRPLKFVIKSLVAEDNRLVLSGTA